MSDVTGAEERVLRDAVAALRARVMALVLAMVGGTGFSLATLWLVIRGGENVGQHLGLLRHYFPGYAVTWWGALGAFFYGALTGAILGLSLAWIYNRIAALRS